MSPGGSGAGYASAPSPGASGWVGSQDAAGSGGEGGGAARSAPMPGYAGTGAAPFYIANSPAVFSFCVSVRKIGAGNAQLQKPKHICVVTPSIPAICDLYARLICGLNGPRGISYVADFVSECHVHFKSAAPDGAYVFMHRSWTGLPAAATPAAGSATAGLCGWSSAAARVTAAGRPVCYAGPPAGCSAAAGAAAGRSSWGARTGTAAGGLAGACAVGEEPPTLPCQPCRMVTDA